MDKLSEWYSNKTNIKKLTWFLRKYIRINGFFLDLDEVNNTIEDIISETYLRLYKKGIINNLHECKPSTLIFRVAERNAISELRKRKRRIRIPIFSETYEGEEKVKYEKDITLMLIDEKEPKFSMPEILLPDKYAEKNELKEILEKSINELDKTHKECFLLKHMGDYPYREIARILDTPIGTAKSKVHRARKKLMENPLIKEYHKNI